MIVTLTVGEVAMAKEVGRRRQRRAESKRHRRYGQAADQAPADHVLGALGEAAVAKALNRFWAQPDFADRQVGDVGPGIHVRATDLVDGSLIIHEADPDEGIFILAIKRAELRGAHWNVVGWIYGADGKEESRYWRENVRHPAFFIPQQELAPIEHLKTAIAV